jgi:hypothetical protein
MRLPQLTLAGLKKLIIRLFPGLAGYHVIRYAMITKVYQVPARDLVNAPAMAVDLQFLKPDFSKDETFPEFRRIRLAGSSEFVQAPPTTGTYVLIHFPYWLNSTATVLSVLYLDLNVAPQEQVYQIRDAQETRISGKTELIFGEGDDQAVLGNELVTVLENICNQIVALGQRDNMGAPLPTLPGVQANLEIIKTMLPDDILSDIKLGKGTDVPVS